MEDFFKKNNKGFSLVELIVVIAVIGVIAVIATPKLIEYVEKSRIGTDRNAIGEVGHAAEVVYVREGRKASDGELLFQVRIDKQGIANYGGDNLSNFVEGVAEVLPPDSYIYKSKAYKGHTVKITVGTDGKAYIDEEIGENLTAAGALGVPDRYKDTVDGIINRFLGEEGNEKLSEFIYDVETELGAWDTISKENKKDKLNELAPGLGDALSWAGVLKDPKPNTGGSDGTGSGGTGSEGTDSTTPKPTPCALCNCTDNTNCSSNHKTLSGIEAFFVGYSNKCKACGATW